MTGPRNGSALRPASVAVIGRELAIAWADGHESYYSLADLRRRCPCARCREVGARLPAASSLPVLGQAPVRDLGVLRVEPVGVYALRIVWSDRHDDGIYSFEALRDACPCESCAAARASREARRPSGATG